MPSKQGDKPKIAKLAKATKNVDKANKGGYNSRQWIRQKLIRSLKTSAL